MKKELIINKENIKSKIYFIRGLKVMLDRDLAELYCVKNKRLNEQVKRNIERFPEEFMFQLNEEEWSILRSQIATTKEQEVQNSLLKKLNCQIEILC